MELHQIKSLSTTKEAICKLKRQLSEEEKISANYIPQNIQGTHTTQEQLTQLKSGQRTYIDIFFKEHIQMDKYIKRGSTALILREMQMKITY